jgi:hypothetical protein
LKEERPVISPSKRIAEPTTMLTDYVLFLETSFLGFLLFKIDQQTSIKFWALAFFMTAIAAVVGGTFHGFIHYMKKSTSAVFWKITVYSIALATFFMFCGSIFSEIPPRLQHWMLALAVLQLVVCIIWVSRRDEFRYLVYNYGPVMLLILILQVIAAVTKHAASAPWLIAGILVSFAAAGIQQSNFKPHEHFNHNDIYHVIQMVAMYLIYRGAALLIDR